MVKWAVDNLNVPYILKEQQTESLLTQMEQKIL